MHTSQRSILAALLPALVACAQTAPPRATPTSVRVRAVGESPGSTRKLDGWAVRDDPLSEAGDSDRFGAGASSPATASPRKEPIRSAPASQG